MNTISKIALALVAVSSVCYGDAHIRTLLDQARAGNPVAMRKLSISLSQGDGGRRNARFAFEWMTKAADAGDVPAIYLLGNMFETGRCTTKSISRAAEYYVEAAKKGSKPAQERLDKMDLQHSRKWHEYAAEKEGRFKSMMTLAKAYAVGKDQLPKDKKKAQQYFLMAYEKDAAKTTKTVLKLPLEQTADFLDYLATEKADVQVMKHLAEAYGNGDGVSVDEGKSNKYYIMAADAGDENAKRIVDAKGLNSLDKALPAYEERAEKGDVGACMKLAEAYWSGKGLPQDKELALKYYRMAAEKNHGPAIDFLHREDPTFETEDDKADNFWHAVAARIMDADFSPSTAKVLLYKNGCAMERSYNSVPREDYMCAFCSMPVFQKVSHNQFFCLVNNDPICIVVPEHVKVNFAEKDTVTGVLVRDGEFPYVNRAGNRRTVRKYVLVCGANM